MTEDQTYFTGLVAQVCTPFSSHIFFNVAPKYIVGGRPLIQVSSKILVDPCQDAHCIVMNDHDIVHVHQHICIIRRTIRFLRCLQPQIWISQTWCETQAYNLQGDCKTTRLHSSSHTRPEQQTLSSQHPGQTLGLRSFRSTRSLGL